MEMPDELKKLKKVIVSFLSQCPGHAAQKQNFWNSIAQYQNKNVSHSMYGVSKMEKVFAMFDDVLVVTKFTVRLRDGIASQSQSRGSTSHGKSNQTKKRDFPITISDSDEDDEDTDSEDSSFQDERKHQQSQMYSRHNASQDSLMSWGSGVCDTSYDSPRSSSASAPPPSNNLSLSGFIPLSGSADGRCRPEGKPKPSHLRYGTTSSDTQAALPPSFRNPGVVPSQPNSSTSQGSSMPPQPSLYRPQPNDNESQRDGFRFQVGQMGSQPSLYRPQPNLSGPQQNLFQPQLPGLQQNLFQDQSSKPQASGSQPAPAMNLMQMPGSSSQTPSTFPQLFLQQGQTMGSTPGSVGAFASPALLQPPISQADQTKTLTEWPKPKARTGPPPGTKITDPPKEIKVKSISLARGARLTTEQVNYEINDCIDILSSVNEHVSIERVEEMLLKKFKVLNFRALNLPQRYMNQMEAASEHSRLLCKINAYIQNFARSRSLCTLYELGECCRDYHKHKEEFEKLRLGPLQKMPVVMDLFKFPVDEYVPEITTIDILEQLRNYLDQHQKWKAQVQLEDFVEFLEKAYEVQSSFSLGLRVRSLPLAIGTLKKASGDAAQSRRRVMEEMISNLHNDIKDAFMRYRESLLQASDGSDSHQLRVHYTKLTPTNAINEILKRYVCLAQVFMVDLSSSKARKIDRFVRSFDSFVKHLMEDPFPQLLFHLAVCMSESDVQQMLGDFMEQQKQHTQQRMQQDTTAEAAQQRPSKHALTDRIVTYVNTCLEQGPLQLSHLKSIEEKVVGDFKFSAFHQFGHSFFLDFLLSDKKIKQALEEGGGTLLGSSSAAREGSGSVIASQKDLLAFVRQSRDAGIVQTDHLAQALCEQYHVTEVKALGHGNINRLCQAADRATRNVARHVNCTFEAAVCGKSCRPTRGSGHVGVQGSQSRESAIACLTACPLLEDLSEWSHWPLLFQPQHGLLRDFITKCGGVQFLSIDGGKRTATSDFAALETEPGKFLKLSAQSTQEDFISALETEDPLSAAGHLVSLIVSNKGIESTPLALFTNHVRAKLNALHARMSTPGAPPHLGSADIVDPAVQFITAMLLRLPLRICLAVANQVLLEPLSQVVGGAKSKLCVLQACQAPGQRLRLEELGCLLGVPEWMGPMAARTAFPAHLVQENVAEDDDLIGQPAPPHQQMEEEEEEEESSEDEDSSEDDEESEIEHMLSESLPERKGVAKEQDESLETSSEDSDEDSSDEEENESDDESDGSEDSEEEKESEEAAEDVKTDADSAQAGEEGTAKDPTETGNELGDAKKAETADDVEKELTKEEKCQEIVNLIREKEFGVGVELTEEIRDLMLKQQERQGRSLERLSKELYSKDTHFVLELIQNADDNHYDGDVTPAIKFVINSHGVTVMNNEQGFEEINIRALCDVGKSTKSKHNSGYIGQKGIGFKSVFRVTGKPEVHSNGYHIYFDVNSGPMGYILPHWADTWEANPSWQTEITLPWTEAIVNQISTHAARFNDVQPSLLLFLHRLKQITIENQVENNQLHMEREDLKNGQVQISHTHGKDNWLVVRKPLDASSVSLQAKSGVDVESTEIALAFPIHGKEVMLGARAKLRYLPVFAYLPLRSYGFKFIVQGDFDVPSSREDVDRDSSWNQWLRNEIPALFLDAWDSFQTLPNLSPVEALISYLQFVPMDGEVMDFFRPVSHHILAQLRAKEFLPVLGPSGETQWKMPSKTVISRDSLVREIISPQLLKHHLALYFLHDDVAGTLDNAQVQALGVERITTEHLLLIGQSIVGNWSGQGSVDQVVDIAKWMACVYRSLDDFQDNSEVMKKLRSLKIIPLSSGKLVAVEDTTVFLLMEDQQSGTSASRRKKGAPPVRDPLQELKSDLSLVHSGLTSTADNEINSQVVKLLMKMEVKQVTPDDLIHGHILPVLESGQWKAKAEKVLVSYLVYVKSEMEKSPSVLDFDRLRPVAPILTNHGLVVPAQQNVHFSRAFKGPFDLKATFPGVKWTLVDDSYLPPSATPLDVQTWHSFLSRLGVNDFLCVRKEEVQLEPSKLSSSPWSAYEGIWPMSADGYVIHDFCCEEFHQLATMSNPAPKTMQSLYLCLNKMWDSEYRNFRFTQLRSGSGDVLKDTVETSFFIHLKKLAWVPACWQAVDLDSDSGDLNSCSKNGCLPPNQLYVNSPHVRDLLGDTVKYLDVSVTDRQSSFTHSIQVKQDVKKEAVKDALVSWGQREASKAKTPKVFVTRQRHILNVYSYLNNELSRKESQDLFHEHPVIFIPLSHAGPNENVAGHMMNREEVCWQDDTELFTKHQKSLELYKSPLATIRFMQPFYAAHEDIFFQARLKKIPDVIDYSELLKHLASISSLQEAGTLRDALLLMSRVGDNLALKDETKAGVATFEAMQARTNVDKVKDLLSPCAVFPTKGSKWIGLADHPMIADSVELERMFADKPGVHFLQTEPPASQQRKPVARRPPYHHRQFEDVGPKVNPESVSFYLSLFEGIRPLSDCIHTEVITSGFKPCHKGQLYMHKVVPLMQQVLYFLFPEVYDKVKQHKAATFKELQFIQVQRLEVKYELTDRPTVYEIKEDKCFVEDKMFYFHEKYIDEQAEIHREVAKFLSLGDEECCRELRNFLSQAVAILEGKSNESMQDLFSRQRQYISDLPEDEEPWEVPLPVMPEPTPVSPLLPDVMDEMVYGRALSEPGSEPSAAQAGTDGGDSNANAMTSWPPRSHVDIPAKGKGKAVSDKTSGKWAPPDAPDYAKASRQLPSNIQFESGEAQQEGEGGDQTTSKPATLARNLSGQGSVKVSKEGGGGQGGGGGGDGKYDEKKRHGGEQQRDGKSGPGPSRQNSSRSDADSHHAGDGDLRQHVVILPEKDAKPGQETGDKRKRKWREGSESEQGDVKRLNSVESSPSEVTERMEATEGQVSNRNATECQTESMPPGDGQGMDVVSGAEQASASPDTQRSKAGDEDQVHVPKKHKFLRFSIPVWGDQMAEVKYTEIASGADLTVQQQQPLPENSQVKEIGRWGEALVYNYLLKEMEANRSILDVIWANSGEETGLPYDIEVLYRTESDDQQYSVFIDVKATVTEDKAVFPVSLNQIECAVQNKERYQIFRVYNAGKKNVCLVRIDNVADRLVTKSVQLYMMV